MHDCGGSELVSPFVVASCSGTTRKHANEPATALQHARPASPSLPRETTGSYSGHTPRLRRLNHRADQGPAPGTTPAAAALPRLVMAFPQTGHVARRCYPPGLAPYVPGSRPSIVSAARLKEPGDFAGRN